MRCPYIAGVCKERFDCTYLYKCLVRLVTRLRGITNCTNSSLKMIKTVGWKTTFIILRQSKPLSLTWPAPTMRPGTKADCDTSVNLYPLPLCTTPPSLYNPSPKVIRELKGAVSWNLTKFKQRVLLPNWVKHKNNCSKHEKKVWVTLTVNTKGATDGQT